MEWNFHIPVLQKEVIKYLNLGPNENFIDCTIGGGGHTLAILEKTASKGKVLGIDSDPKQIENLKLRIENFKKRIILICDNFANLQEIVKETKFGRVSGILFDLGMSSWHLKESGRGFSFQKNEPLDMRYSLQNPLTAEKIINYWSEPDIEKILKEFGQERFARKIANEIVKERKLISIKTTWQLVKIIKRIVPRRYQKQRIHFATKTFQALRIAVNDELNNLEKALPQTIEILNHKGRLVVISFHSLEDKIVKDFLKKSIGDTYSNLKVLNKKIITPTKEEIKINPRSRSARLRAAEKI